MNDFVTNLSSPTSTKSSVITNASPFNLKQRICISKESNENDQESNQMSSKLQNPKKSITKHFMSPTFSAASKASGQRKKVLTERNEASSGSILSDTHVHMNASASSEDLGLNNSTQITPLSSRVSESKHDFADLGTQPYDPLKNYLSPRPKFLRYNPNRRVEILHRQENELRKGGNGLGGNLCTSVGSKSLVEQETSSHDLDSLSPKRSIKQEDGSSNSVDNSGLKSSMSDFDDEDVVEEVEEERHWHLNKVLKFLILLGVLILSTLYISSMNSPTPPRFLQSMRELKEGYQKIQERVSQVAVNDFVDQIFMEANERFINEEAEKEDLVELVIEKPEEVFDQIELPEIESAKTYDSLQVSQTQFVPTSMNYTEMVDENLSTSCDTTSKLDQERITEVLEAGLISNDEQVRDEAIQSTNHETMSFEPNQLPIEDISSEGIGRDEMLEDEVENVVDISDDMGAMIELHGRENIDFTESLEAPQTEIFSTSETELNSEEGQSETSKSDLITKGAMGISLLSVILGFLHLKRRKISENDSSPAIQPSVESTVVEDEGVSLHKNEGRTKEEIVKADTYVNPSSSVHIEGKGSIEVYRSQAPVVELLGEYVVAGQFSNTLKNCSLKSNLIEGEYSNFSESVEKKYLRRKGVMSPANREYQSAAESDSNGRFTPREKIVRKEEGSGELLKLSTTPVRRSSRIRNRAVMSPQL